MLAPASGGRGHRSTSWAGSARASKLVTSAAKGAGLWGADLGHRGAQNGRWPPPAGTSRPGRPNFRSPTTVGRAQPWYVVGLGSPPAQGLAGGKFGPSTITCPSLPLCSSPGSPTDVPAIFQEDSHPRRLGLTPGSPAPRPDLAPVSGSAAAPCSRLPCSLPSLSPLPPPALAPSWPLPTSLGPSPAFYKPSSFSRSTLSAPFLSPHRASGAATGEDPALDARGMRLLPAAGLEAWGPRPQLD